VGSTLVRCVGRPLFSRCRRLKDAGVTINGKSGPPRGFWVALLGEDRSEFLVFKDGNDDWLEYGDYTYRKCN
jgi:hypothetical protein